MVDMHARMSELYRERDDLAAAAQHLLACQELGEHNGLPQHPYRWRVALARVEEAQGNLAGALDLLDEAQRRYVSDFFPNVRPVPALKARVWIAQGRLGDALGWAREQGLSADDDLRPAPRRPSGHRARGGLRPGGGLGILARFVAGREGLQALP